MQNFHIYIFFSFSPPPPPKRCGASGGGGRRRGSAEGRSPPPTPAAASEHRLGGGGGEKEKKIYIWKFCIYTKMQYSTFTNMLNFFNLKSFYRPWLWKNNPFRGRRFFSNLQQKFRKGVFGDQNLYEINRHGIWHWRTMLFFSEQHFLWRTNSFFHVF